MHREISDDPSRSSASAASPRRGRLSNPHVVTVIDAGRGRGLPLHRVRVRGRETLKERIKRVGRLPVTEAVAYAIEIGRALQAAHGAASYTAT